MVCTVTEVGFSCALGQKTLAAAATRFLSSQRISCLQSFRDIGPLAKKFVPKGTPAPPARF